MIKKYFIGCIIILSQSLFSQEYPAFIRLRKNKIYYYKDSNDFYRFAPQQFVQHIKEFHHYI